MAQDEFWLPLVDEPIGELVARLQKSGGRSVLEQMDVDRLTEILTGKAAPPA